MGTLGKFLKWGFLSGLGLLLVLIAAWAVSRAMYPTDSQRDAMARLEQPPDHAGENAFALLWTLDRAISDGELQTVMAKDIRRYTEKPPPDAVERSPAPGHRVGRRAVSRPCPEHGRSSPFLHLTQRRLPGACA